ncbi:hypothetical protein NDN08_007510 [Rhodosorus marinus]|uniref:Malonyl-CoA:ACP transacylase (MAT) domain-containing protein n=1 Tax=Rhodosorus marinus TaxID=101924 RepID=A0AAV8UXR5_9RHOD|nr:hypothetical protein NDN08_007510 [Rhodosorus marinus]
MSASPVVLCPGQGAQSVGMGKTWKEKSKAAQKIFDRADAVLGDRLGSNLSEIIMNGPKSGLDRTDVAQPAIFVTSIASWDGMKELELVPPGTPATAAGLSLGEYTALTVGGAIEFEAALELVALRGLAMQEASEAVDSTMCALVGADEEKATSCIEYALERCKGQVLVAANYNAPGQVVLSGSSEACNMAATYAADEMKLRAVMLDVAGAFHSPLMAPAAARLGDALAGTSIEAPACPVLANVTGLPHEADPESIRNRLIEQLTNPTRWADCMSYYKSNPEVAGDGDWLELAPGKTLTGIMKKCDRRRKVMGFDSPPE